jgi:hypothetical protein
MAVALLLLENIAMMVQKLTRVIILLMFLLNLRKLVGSTVTIGKSSDDGSKSSKGVVILSIMLFLLFKMV